MKKFILSLLLISLFSLAGCGNYESVDEAFEEEASSNVVKKLVTVRGDDDLAFVLYLSKPDKENFPAIKENVLAIDTFINNDGWEKAHGGSWTHYENDNLTVYNERYIKTTENGETKKITRILFGEINNPEIVRVEVSIDGETFVPADLDKDSNKRFYYIIGDYKIVRGLSADGEVLDQQGG